MLCESPARLRDHEKSPFFFKVCFEYVFEQEEQQNKTRNAFKTVKLKSVSAHFAPFLSRSDAVTTRIIINYCKACVQCESRTQSVFNSTGNLCRELFSLLWPFGSTAVKATSLSGITNLKDLQTKI